MIKTFSLCMTQLIIQLEIPSTHMDEHHAQSQTELTIWSPISLGIQRNSSHSHLPFSYHLGRPSIFLDWKKLSKSSVHRNIIIMDIIIKSFAKTAQFLSKGSHPPRKVQFFLTLFKRPLTPPPPFVWTFFLFCRGCFLKRVFEHLI